MGYGYESEGEYNAAMQSQGEAEAEYQAHADYHNFLNELMDNGNMFEYYLYTMAEELESDKFKKSGKTASQYLRDLAHEKLNKTKEGSESIDSGELPF